MPEIKIEFLFTIALEVQVFNLGDTPYGGRRIARFGTGSFEGPKLKGTVLPGGGGWILMRRDDVLEIDVRLTLETDDKQGDVLFPHHAILRDELAKVRLDEPHLLDRHRLAHGERADLPGVSGVVGMP